MTPAMEDIGPFSAIVRWDPIPPRGANGEITNYTVNYRISEPTMSSSSRKKRQIVDGMLVEACITGGADNIDQNLTVGGDQTSANLRNLSKKLFLHQQCMLRLPSQFTVQLCLHAAPNVQYEVRIQAVNALGFGEFSNATIFRTNEYGKLSTLSTVCVSLCSLHTEPSEPLSLTVEYITSTSLNVTWQRPLCEYGVITNYTVSNIV